VQERSRAEAYAAAQAAAPGPGVAELHAALRRHFSALGKEFEAKQISALRSLEGATTVVAASQRAVGFAQMRREEFRQLHAELDKRQSPRLRAPPLIVPPRFSCSLLRSA
jgi:hypothetical protein